MPLPPAYNYSPALQPSAWWTQAQQQIPGLPGLPSSGSALASSYEQYAPYQSALANLYQQSMAAPGVGTMTQEGAEPTPIPTEAGGSALAELLASTAGVSRSSTTNMAGTPGQIGETMYGYGGAAPVLAQTAGPQMVGGWATANPYGEGGGPNVGSTGFGSGGGSGTGSGGGATPPATPPAGGGATGVAAPGIGGEPPKKEGPTPLPPDMSTYPGYGAFWDGFQWHANAFVNPPPGYDYGVT